MIDLEREILKRSEIVRACAESTAPAIRSAGRAITKCLLKGGKVVTFGNGGSASDSQHLVAELVGRFLIERASLPAIALPSNTPTLTAIANDYGYSDSFSRQVEGLCTQNDVVFALSTSGNSQNVIKAIQTAKQLGIETIGLVGSRGGKLAELADISIVAPSTATPAIQECHILAIHLLCEMIDDCFGPEPCRLRSGVANCIADLVEFRSKAKRAGLKVAWTNGCFDILHEGHVHSLQSASTFADFLIVGVNSDNSVRRLKGKGRPFNNERTRAQWIANAESVDHVLIFDEDTPMNAISQLQPDVICKGTDYRPPDGKPMPEKVIVEEYGGRVEFIDLLPGKSTTSISERSGMQN